MKVQNIFLIILVIESILPNGLGLSLSHYQASPESPANPASPTNCRDVNYTTSMLVLSWFGEFILRGNCNKV
jgi:hypothetical protein